MGGSVSSSGWSGGLWQVGWFLAGADPPKEPVQVGAVNFQLNGRAVWLYRLVKASRVAASWVVLAKSLGEMTFFCTMEKKTSG